MKRMTGKRPCADTGMDSKWALLWLVEKFAKIASEMKRCIFDVMFL